MITELQNRYIERAINAFKFSKYYIVYDFKNKYGTFEGIWSLIGDGSQALRFNFKSFDKLDSVDIWNKISSIPSHHLEVLENNDDQLFAMISNVIFSKKVESVYLKRKLTEAGINPVSIDTFNRFISDKNYGISDLKRTPALQLYKQFEIWFDSLDEQSKFELQKFSKASFDRILAQSMLSRGEVTNFAKSKTAVKVMRGETDTIIDNIDMIQLEDEFREVMDDSYDGLNRLAQSFEFLENEVTALVKGRRTGLFVCGQSGVGKTHGVKEYLRKAGGFDRGRYMKGVIKTERDLIVKLYEHREDKILVLDDVDSILKNPKCIELLNIVLEPEKRRRVQVLDMKLAKEFDLPQAFDFTSRVIIITNKRPMYIPQKLIDRTPVIEFLASKMELLDWIYSNKQDLKNSNDEPISDTAKEAVFAYFSSILDQVKFFSFRNFKFACMRYEECMEDNKGDKWKDWTLADLQSGKGGRF